MKTKKKKPFSFTDENPEKDNNCHHDDPGLLSIVGFLPQKDMAEIECKECGEAFLTFYSYKK